MNIVLGSKVRCIVTGCEGLVTARHEYLNGCVRYTVQEPKDKDGKLPDEKWFDVGQLETVDAGISKKIIPKKTGGPTSTTPNVKLKL